uniref:Uncharacterized protein n=1 Tax=Anguilla anguilla TaxID=7936 RepID=A0A0E9X5F8_ANGAN
MFILKSQVKLSCKYNGDLRGSLVLVAFRTTKAWAEYPKISNSPQVHSANQLPLPKGRTVFTASYLVICSSCKEPQLCGLMQFFCWVKNHM